ncbi:MAG: hypothetical protein V4492_04320 [Chlamydiota bacterium]
MKKSRKGWLILVVLGAVVITFHKPLLLTGFKIALNTAIPRAPGRIVSYRDIQWENNQITLSGFELKDAHSELIIERIEITPKGSIFRFSPEISVIDPELRFRSFASGSAPVLPLLFRSQWFTPKWKIDGGTLEMPSKEQLYFSMIPGEEAGEMGTIALFDRPGQATSPMLSCQASLADDLLHIGFKLQHTDLSAYLPLSALIFPEMRREWEVARGVLDLEGDIAFNKKLELRELNFFGSTQHVALISQAMGIEIKCDECKGSLSYPASDEGLYFWDKLSAAFSLRSATCLLNEPLVVHSFGMQNVAGEIRLEPSLEPQLSLQGMLVQSDKQLPFTLSGKGSMQQDDRFWSVIECQCVAPSGEKMQALLSLCRHAMDQDVVQLKIDHATFEHLDFFRGFNPLPGHCVAGTAHLEATWLYQNGACQNASIDSCSLDGVRWYFPEEKLTAYADLAKGECALERDAQGNWSVSSLQLEMQAGDLLGAQHHLSDLNVQYGIHRQVVQPSHFEGKWGGLEARVDLLGPGADHFGDITLFGDARTLFPAIKDPYRIAMHGVVGHKAHQFELALNGELAGDAIQGTVQWEGAIPLSLTTFSAPQFVEANFKADALTPKSYAFLLPRLLPGIHLAGTLSCQAHLTPTSATVSIGGDDILLQHPYAEMQIPAIKGNLAQFQWSEESGKWMGALPVFDGKIYVSGVQLPFDNVETKFIIDGSQIKAPSFYAECEGLALRGNLALDLKGNNQVDISLATTQIAGSVQNLSAALGHLPSGPKFGFPIDGSLSSGEGGFVLKTTLGSTNAPTQMRFQAALSQVSFPLNEASHITDGNCEIAYDFTTQRIEIGKAEAKWNLKEGAPLTIRLHQLATDLKQGSDFAFALDIVDGKNEAAHLAGKASINPQSHWEVDFDPLATHFFGTPLNISRCQFDRSLKLIAFEMKPIIRCQDLAGHAYFLQNAGVLGASFSIDHFKQWQLEGTLQAHVSTDNLKEGFSFHAESRDLTVKGKPWNGFLLKGQKLGQKWLIETFEGHGVILRGAFLVDLNGVTIPQFAGSYLGLQMQGSGALRTEQKRLSCKLDSLKGDLSAFAGLGLGTVEGPFTGSGNIICDYGQEMQLTGEFSLNASLQEPFPITLATTKPFRFEYTPQNGLSCEDLDLHCKHHSLTSLLGTLQVKTLERTNPDSLSLKQLKLNASAVLLHHLREVKAIPPTSTQFAFEKTLEVAGDLELGKNGPVFQGTFRPGKYGFKGKHIDFEQLQVRYEKELVSFKGKTLLESNPLWMLLQVDISQEPFGVLKLFDDPKTEGLKVLFSTHGGAFHWESVHGRCYGLQCNLTKSSKRKLPAASVLVGDIQMDVKTVASLLPQEWRARLGQFKVGKGYEWEGDLTLWNDAVRGFQMSGDITGKDFEIFGYELGNMKATLEATPGKVLISKLNIEDEGGIAKIDSILISKMKDWELFIPQIQVSDLQPSLLTKVDAAAVPLKPFTIKNFVLKDVRGKLGDKDTLEGTGRLTFTNQFKKEFSILDIPLELIKNIGLDPGILTPINGELELELRGDKFYLMALNNAYSEGRRSEFYLAPSSDLSFIDLEGKMHIDLKLRQEVVLKLMEPFTLTIRGTIDKPRYGLQF